jgi:hypothetical protein
MSEELHVCPKCRKGKMRPQRVCYRLRARTPIFSVQSDTRTYKYDNDDCRRHLIHSELMENVRVWMRLILGTCLTSLSCCGPCYNMGPWKGKKYRKPFE